MVGSSGRSPGAGSVATSAGTQGRFDGRVIPLSALVLIGCGTFGGVLFAGVYLIEGATRSGYDAWQYAISVLSLGPGGWVQRANFIVFGVLVVASAFGWRMALKPGAGATWYPILKGITGVGLIVDGFFSQDPVIGYPVGTTVVEAPTTHGIVHNLAAFVTITAIAVSCFVLARRFAVEPRWRGWALYAVATGLLTMGLIAAFGAMNGHAGAPAGLFERLATGINTILSLLVFSRLLLDRRGVARQ
ncbi:MAG: DUF998 domain-containing protein [Ktedonobacterales bacterium]